MGAQNDMRVTIRVDRELKERAETLFDRLGMNMSTALNVFLRKAVDEAAIPFAVSARGAGFGAGLTAEDITRSFTSAVAGDIAETRRNGQPVARYDAATRRAYLEKPDGSREYVDE